MLAASSVAQPNHKQKCRHPYCDNCRRSRAIKYDGEYSKDVPINKVVVDILSRFEYALDFDTLCKEALFVGENYSSEKDAWLISALLDYNSGNRNSCILYSLFRLLSNHFHDGVSVEQCIEWVKSIKSGNESIYLRSSRESWTSVITTGASHQILFNRIVDIEAFIPRKTRKVLKFPFLIQYELLRLDLSSTSDDSFWQQLEANCNESLFAACQYLYRAKKLSLPSIFKQLKSDAGASQHSSPFFFSCELLHDHNGSNPPRSGLVPNLKLNQPQLAYRKRIYRHYSSDRFLEVNVSSHFALAEIERTFANPIVCCGRTFRYMWCKKEKSPQAYLLFAEKGVGIPREDELTVEKLMDRCIPKALNPEITISKFSKRMKLSFSTTMEGPIINQSCISVVPDFELPEFSEIDGAGLISSAALEMIWETFKQNEEYKRSGVVHDTLQYTGFQGRIGGYVYLYASSFQIKPVVHMKICIYENMLQIQRSLGS
jgi:RNA dependent RNA polymerase